MSDPDRPRSSVPDPLPDAFGKLPRAEVFEEPESRRTKMRTVIRLTVGMLGVSSTGLRRNQTDIEPSQRM